MIDDYAGKWIKRIVVAWIAAILVVGILIGKYVL